MTIATTLGALANAGVLAMGDGYRTKGSEYDDAGIPILRVADVLEGKVVPSFKDRVSLTRLSQIGPKQSRAGDVIVTTKGTVGRVALIPESLPSHVYSPQLCYLRVADSSQLDHRWLYSWARSPQFQRQTGSVKDQTDMAPYVSLGDLRRFRIQLPPLDEQRRIAEVLGALDDLIDTNNRSISSTEALLQAHFEAMSFDSPGGVALVDRVELNPSYPKPKGIAPYVDMAALPTNSFFIEEVSNRPAAGGARFMRDDVVFARITPCLENGKAAFAGNLVPGEVYVGSTEFIVMRAKQGVPSAWPYFLARSERFREFAIRHMTGSSGRQRLAAASLENYEVGGDSDALLEFDRLATTLLDAAAQLSVENEQLRRTRDELLPLLMSGAVRVRPEVVAA